MVIVASDLERDRHYSYPQLDLSGGQPRKARDGEWYSIRRFKNIRAELGPVSGFEPTVFRLLLGSIVCTIISE